MKKGTNKSKSSIIFFLLLLIFIALSLYYYVYIYTVNSKTREDMAAVRKISSMMQLPSDETPTVATVTDPTKLNRQPFFKNSMKGDKVVVYMKVQKAILFRPTTGKIIEVAPVVSK